MAADDDLICIGCIRGGRVLYRIGGARAPDSLVLKSASGPVALEPADAEQTAALTELTNQLPPKARRRLRTRPWRADLTAAFDPLTLVPDLSLEARENGAERPVLWGPAIAALDHLTPLTEEEFRTGFSFENRRHADPETARFIAAQILKGPVPQDPAAKADEALEPPPGYLVNALVIWVYKSIEIGRLDEQDALAAFTERAVSALDRIPAGGLGVRSDGEHLRISLDMALWHFAIARGDRQAALTHLRAIMAFQAELLLTVNRSYNVCRTGLMLGILLLALGQKSAAAAAFDDTVVAFRRGVATILPRTSNVNWFVEMADTHAATANAMILLRGITSKKPAELPVLIEMADAAVRVKTPAFQGALADFLTAAVRSAETRAARREAADKQA